MKTRKRLLFLLCLTGALGYAYWKFAIPTHRVGISAELVMLGDLDGDSDLDAFTGIWRGGPRIWLNDGKGKFVDSQVKLASLNSAGVAIADLDGDGDLDVFVSTNTWTGGDGCPKLWLNQLKTIQ